MTNELWENTGRRRWQYTRNRPDYWLPDIAEIIVRAQNDWGLFINGQYVAAFDTWEAARDATPMLITLHGHTKDES